MERGWQWHIAPVCKKCFTYCIKRPKHPACAFSEFIWKHWLVELLKNPWLLCHKIYSAVGDMVCDDNIILFHNGFTSSGEQPEQCILAHNSTTNCRLCSNISQILLLCKTWGYYNKFDSTKSFGAYYWYVTISQCEYMKHGLKHITFYV